MPESVPERIPWPTSSLSQEIYHETSISNLDHDQNQHYTGQQKEARTWSRGMMIIHLHRGEENLLSHSHEG
jgi:hypothetical protein